MTPAQALAEAASGELRPVYLLFGEERYLREQALRALREAGGRGDTTGWNDSLHVAGDVEAATVLDLARTLPMFAKRRVVVVRNVERWEKTSAKSTKKSALDLLVDYVGQPAPETLLLLETAKFERHRKLKKLAEDGGWLVECAPLRGPSVTRWVRDEAGRRGIQLGPGVADMLGELVGPELSLVADALERVGLYAGARPVTEDDVVECVTPVRPTQIWDLTDAVARGDLGEALATLHRVFDARQGGLLVTGALASAARRSLRYSALRAEGRSSSDAATSVGLAWKARELEAQHKASSVERKVRWLERLARVDLELKGGSRRPARASLERALVEACRRSNRTPA